MTSAEKKKALRKLADKTDTQARNEALRLIGLLSRLLAKKQFDIEAAMFLCTDAGSNIGDLMMEFDDVWRNMDEDAPVVPTVTPPAQKRGAA